MVGVVYMIISKNTDKVYIGQTTLKLSVRFNQHLSKLNDTRSKIVISYGDVEIKIIDTSDDLEELKIKEQEYIQFFKDIAVNVEVYNEPKNIQKESLNNIRIIGSNKQPKNISDGELDFIHWYEKNIEVCDNYLNRAAVYRNYVLNSETVLSKQNFFELMIENAGEAFKSSGGYYYKNIGFKNDNNPKKEVVIPLHENNDCDNYEKWLRKNILHDTNSRLIRSSVWKKFETDFTNDTLRKKELFKKCEKIFGKAIKITGNFCFPGYKLIC